MMLDGQMSELVTIIQRSPEVKFQLMTSGPTLGGASDHNKAHGLFPFPHQRKSCTEGLLGRHALGTCMLGKTL